MAWCGLSVNGVLATNDADRVDFEVRFMPPLDSQYSNINQSMGADSRTDEDCARPARHEQMTSSLGKYGKTFKQNYTRTYLVFLVGTGVWSAVLVFRPWTAH